jgi:hypothetical protein
MAVPSGSRSMIPGTALTTADDVFGKHSARQDVKTCRARKSGVVAHRFWASTHIRRPRVLVYSTFLSLMGSRAPRSATAVMPAVNARAAQRAAPTSCDGWAGQIHGVDSAGPCHWVYKA